MHNKFDESAIGKSFKEIDYIELADGAAQRTRWTAIILVIATVIIFIGFYNSTRSSWGFTRLALVYNNENLGEINTKPGNGTRPILDSFFSNSDFKDTKTLKAFGCQIFEESNHGEKPATTLSSYLYGSFNAKTQKLMLEECTTRDKKVTEEPSDVFQKSLLFDLNTILKDKQLYKYRQFETRRNQQQEIDRLYNKAGDETTNKLKIHELIRLNRLLLEESYADKISASRDIIPIDSDDDGNILSSTEKTRLHAQNELSRAYVDNIQYINIPVFGISIDVNDLGLIGGISLFIILLLYRFNLSREIKNLNISFREAFRHGHLDTFYHNLAMRQVLTVPEMKGETKNTVLDYSAKTVSLLPAIVMFYGVGYDWYSVLSLKLFEFNQFWYLLLIEVGIAVVVFIVSLKCLERKLHIDEIWSDYYYLIESKLNFEFIKTGKFDPKGRFQKIIRERFFDETIDKRFWLWKLLERFPGFLIRIWKRFLVSRFIIWIKGRNIDTDRDNNRQPT
jgi:hypothetical protein